MTDRERLQYMAEQMVDLRAERFEIGFTNFLCGFVTGLFFVWACWSCFINR